MREAFQVKVGDGDPDMSESKFTSPFGMIITPSSMNTATVNSIRDSFEREG